MLKALFEQFFARRIRTSARKRQPRLVLETLEQRLVLSLPTPDHVVIAIDENHGYSQIIGSSSAPYINLLAQQGALMTNSFAIEHPSQPNYLDLFSGSNQGVTNDSCPHTFSTPNLGGELIVAGRTFGGYSESLPAVGSTVCISGSYARKHNPWVNFADVPSQDNLAFTSFPSDFTQLPTVSIVVPNQANDMHDGTIQQGDTWLQNNLDGYVQWAKTHNSLFILTFDEDNDAEGNHIATMFVGPMVLAGQYGEHVDHFNVLRTLEDMYGLPHAGASSTASPITDVFGVPSGVGQIALVPARATWTYLDNGSNQGTAWRSPGFDDSTWSAGPAQLGYGDGDEATVVSFGPDPNNKFITTYFRRPFFVADPSLFTGLSLNLLRDDGAVVYLNGTEVVRSNMPSTTIASSTLASSVVGGAAESSFLTFSVSPTLLVSGTNVLAVEIHQANLTSSDISFDLQLIGATPQDPGCAASVSAAVLTISCDGADSLAALSRDAAGAILLNGSPITGGPTVSNTDTISILGGAGNDQIIIDQTEGLFAPGLAAESTGIGEIELSIDGGAGLDALRIVGRDRAADAIDLGAAGINLDGDDDVDLTLTGIDSLGVYGQGRSDVLNASGTAVVGGPYPSAVTLSGGLGQDTVIGGTGNDSLTGDEGGDSLIGGFGNDTLDGGPGNDLLQGDQGNDSLVGGTGTDRVVQSADATQTLKNTSLTGLGTDTLSAIEQAELYGGPGANMLDASLFTLGPVTLTGGAGNDTLKGGSGADLLSGGAGGDTLQGNSGNDTLSGGADNDSLVGGLGTDRVREVADVSFTLTNSRLTGLGTDTLSSIQAAELIGGAGNNLLNASSFSNGPVTLDGGAGNDTLRGGSKKDSLVGGDGDDSILGGSGNDILLGGLGSDILSGDGGNDTLNGGDVAIDQLLGGSGTDTAIGPRDLSDILNSIEIDRRTRGAIRSNLSM